MRNKTLEDLNSESGFFAKYNEINAEHFSTLFGNADESEINALDNLLTDVKGDMSLLDRYTKIFVSDGASDTTRRIVILCDTMHFEQWKQIKETIDSAYTMSVEKPLTETRSKTVEREGTATDNRQDKTNAFDDTQTASDTDSSIIDNEHSETLTETENTQKSNGALTTENAKKKIDFVKYNDLLVMILDDIVKTACVAVW